jgi:ribosomal protein L37AE/L43A
MATQTTASCFGCGKGLSTRGGGGLFLCTKCVDKIQSGALR